MDIVPEAYKPYIKARYLCELLRFRASMVKVWTGTKNQVLALLSRLNITNPYIDFFGKKGMPYLKGLDLAPVYRKAMDAHLRILAAVDRETERAD